VPWADSVGALRELRDAGVIRAVGLSNVDTAQVREARAILGDALVSFLPWSPLGGISRSSFDGPSGATSAGTPFHRVAAARGVSPQRVCLAWLLAHGPAVLPVPGASRPASVRDSAAAAGLDLTAAEPADLDGFRPDPEARS
jgi:aryl-alcohol dehydrogenase-like predicted oxidoreductase